MAADRTQLMEMLRRADQAGDAEAAKVFLRRIKRLDQTALAEKTREAFASKQPETFAESLRKEAEENTNAISGAAVGFANRAKDMVRGVSGGLLLGDKEQRQNEAIMEQGIGPAAKVGRVGADVAATYFPLARGSQMITQPLQRIVSGGTFGAAYGGATTPGDAATRGKSAAAGAAAGAFPGISQAGKNALPRVAELVERYPWLRSIARLGGSAGATGTAVATAIDPERMGGYAQKAFPYLVPFGAAALAARYPGLAGSVGTSLSQRIGDPDAPQ